MGPVTVPSDKEHRTSDLPDDDEMDGNGGLHEGPNSKLPGKISADIDALRQSVKTLKVWDMDLDSHLNGLQSGINLIESTVPDADKSKFTLSDGAYVIYNAGNIWAKRVDETCRLAIRISDSLSTTDSRKANKETDENEEKEKRQPRSKHVHPLSVPPDERKGDYFLLPRAGKKVPISRCTAKDFPQLPVDAYLSEVQPRSLGLMEHEKIRPYLDDRGNKGNDWADFRINTLNLTPEGYFPIQLLHPDLFERPAQNNRPRITISALNDIPYSDGGYDDIGQEDVPMNEGHEEEHNDRGLSDTGQDGATVVATRPLLEPTGGPNVLPLSEGRRDRPINIPHAPFTKTISIADMLASRGIGPDTAPADIIPQELHAFRMRTKRVLQKKPSRHVSTEIEFFQYFWDIPEKCTSPTIRLGKVLKRYSQRLRRVETVVPARGRKRKQVHVTFVSNGDAGECGESFECPFAVPDVPPLNFRQSGDRFDQDDGDDGPEYVETDEPIGADPHFDNPPLGDDNDDLFHRMRRDGHFYRPSYRGDGDLDNGELDITVTSSQIGNVDLCEWESRLTDFLTVHEINTLTFNLEEFGENLIVRGKSISGGVQDLRGVMRRNTAGDVCRSFLSMLDLANKNKIHFQSSEANGDGSGERFALSQGAEEVEFVIN